MAVFTDTNLADLIPKIWSKDINVSYDNDLVFAKLFWDKSDELAMGGDTLYIPNLGSFSTADTKSNGTALTTSSRTESKITLTVDTWVYKAFGIEDREAAQVSMAYGIMTEYAKKAGQSVAEALELAIAGLFASFTNSVGNSTSNLTEDVVRDAIRTARKANMHKKGMFFIFHTDVIWAQLLSPTLNNVYVSFDYATVKRAAGEEMGDATNSQLSPVGKLGNVLVYESNNVPYVTSTTGRVNVLATKDAIVFATLNLGGNRTAKGEIMPKVRLQADYLIEYLQTEVVADMCYGVALNRNTDGGVRILTKA